MAQQHLAEHHVEEHPTPRTYLKVATILTIITAVEVAVYYIDALEDLLVYILVVLSGIKFSIVVGYYMHLKFDNKLFRNIFVFALMVAMAIIVSFMILFERFGNQ
jgi:cytochrome c oxidase subunit 4